MRHFRADYNRIQDPINKIGENEPVLLLRAQDRCAPAAADAYADIAEREGASAELVETVRKGAQLMRDWQKDNPIKTPDMPEGAGL